MNLKLGGSPPSFFLGIPIANISKPLFCKSLTLGGYKMPNYVSFLKAINVGGRNKIKMAELKQSYTELGFESVESYLQSGNVMFSSSQRSAVKLEQEIEKQIEKDFGLNISVVVRSISGMKKVVEQNPYSDEETYDPKFVGICFLKNAHKLTELEGGDSDSQCFLTPKHLFFYVPSGFANTKWTNGFIEKKTLSVATTRNLNTVNRVAKWKPV